MKGHVLKTLISRLNRNPVFRFSSSVKFAVPLMLVLAFVVACGTVVESRYNSEYARLVIYSQPWFLALLVLLFINVMNAALSRIPWRRKHTGFVITHLGLMTLLTGAMITSIWGIDGQMQVAEGGENNQVILPKLMLAYKFEGTSRPQRVTFDKPLSVNSRSTLGAINSELDHILTAEQILPFANLHKTIQSGEAPSGDSAAVSFILQSQFFNVSEWLQSEDTPELQLGPATLKLIVDRAPVTAVVRHTPPATRAPASAQLFLKDAASGETLKTWDAGKNQFAFKGVTVTVIHRYTHAVVAGNKLREGTEANSALELTISAGGKSLREVLFAQFPTFSLNNGNNFGYRFEYHDSSVPENATPETVQDGGHVVEFHVNPTQRDLVTVALIRDGQRVGQSQLHEGQTFQTPWMGMTISLGSLVWGGRAVYTADSVPPQRGQELPPSALFVKPVGAKEGFWLAEGDARAVQLLGRNAEVTFGRETLTLPFSLHLNKFTKIDYPGTDKALSFESEVTADDGVATKISMNEPLKKDGFTVYQASYSLSPNGPPVSIFSVNRDPGRLVKYFGALILTLGFIIFTLTRSRYYKL